MLQRLTGELARCPSIQQQPVGCLLVVWAVHTDSEGIWRYFRLLLLWNNAFAARAVCVRRLSAADILLSCRIILFFSLDWPDLILLRFTLSSRALFCLLLYRSLCCVGFYVASRGVWNEEICKCLCSGDLGCPYIAASRLFFGGGRVGGLFVSREVESGRLVQKHGGKQVALVKLQGINDRAAATALSGFQVYVHPKQSSSLLPPHSVLAADLVGFDVRLSNNPNKEIIGKVADVVSKHDMRLKPEAVGAADDCLEIEFYKDLPARRLLMEAYRDPAAPPPALLASALHALGPDQPPSMQLEEEEPPVLYECEGCGLRFSDCAAAVTHERLCLQATQRSSKCPDKCGSQQTTTSSADDQDALQWMLQTAAAACDLPTHEQQQQQRQQQVQGCSGKGLWEGENSAQVSPPSVPHELLSLEGPEGRSGRRLGRHFYQRLSLGSLVSWDRGRRFFPKKGEAATDAAERALNFACPSSSGGEASKYAEADWSDTHDVVNLSSCLGVAPGLSSVTCETDKKPKSNSFLLPFVLGVTVEEIKVESKAIAINAPPGLLH
ncbi:16S rRNA processing protein RimM, putative [Eimeria maxima]|uniref:16S rRNA processing protein RimM, putative n=1 Tax=Eimeria maxima TaxID=5804 RepID=U6M4J5_EIMMA|nr:16S rRNA processing protein RimM, putative [Eimeria maxima]CDJ56580.1 16S rRNA processing protein RimM, putative [Eimeria maxima]